MDPRDAVLAVDAQVDAIIVSNHGGRQLDFSPATLEVLPSIVAAVDKRLPIWIDGGIRRGTDIIKVSSQNLPATHLLWLFLPQNWTGWFILECSEQK